MCPANHNSKHQHNNQHCINQFNTHTHWTTLNTQIHIHNNQHQTPFLLKITFTILLWIAHPAPLRYCKHTIHWNVEMLVSLLVLTHPFCQHCQHYSTTTVSFPHCIFSFSFRYQFIIAITHTTTTSNLFVWTSITKSIAYHWHCFYCWYNQNPNMQCMQMKTLNPHILELFKIDHVLSKRLNICCCSIHSWTAYNNTAFHICHPCGNCELLCDRDNSCHDSYYSDVFCWANARGTAQEPVASKSEYNDNSHFDHLHFISE